MDYSDHQDNQSGGQSTSAAAMPPRGQSNVLPPVPEDGWENFFEDELGQKPSSGSADDSSISSSPSRRVSIDPPGSTLPYNREEEEEEEDTTSQAIDQPLAPNLITAKEMGGGNHSDSARTFGTFMESIPEEGNSMLSTASFSFLQPPPAHLLHSTDDDDDDEFSDQQSFSGDVEQTIIRLPEDDIDHPPLQEQSLASLSYESFAAASSRTGSGLAAPANDTAAAEEGRANQLNIDDDDDDGLPRGHELHVDDEQRQQQERRKRAMIPAVIYLAVGFLFLAGVVVAVIILVGGTTAEQEEPMMVVATPTPTTAMDTATITTTLTTMAPTRNATIFNLLPNFTRESIQSDSNSPQALAYQWLLDDNDAGETLLSEDRILQRFALATLFYATRGPTEWLQSNHWLNHSRHECDWFQNKDQYTVLGATSNNETIPDGSPCWDPASPNQTDSLQYLRLQQNQLQGTLPPELSLLTNLVRLDLMSNDLTNTIPTELGQLSLLQVLGLSENPSLGGTIPAELASIGSLTRFSVADTNVTGQVPDELCAIDTIEFTCSNQLCGCVWCACETAAPVEVQTTSDGNNFGAEQTAKPTETALVEVQTTTNDGNEFVAEQTAKPMETDVPMPINNSNTNTPLGITVPVPTSAPTSGYFDMPPLETSTPTNGDTSDILGTDAPVSTGTPTSGDTTNIPMATSTPTNSNTGGFVGDTTTGAPTDGVTTVNTDETTTTEYGEDGNSPSGVVNTSTTNPGGSDANGAVTLGIIIDAFANDNATQAVTQEQDYGSMLIGQVENFQYVEPP
ncbi:Leucine Rich Repeat [Seminavis robusta]|uniref:Leucine Rich Repeat n=1 Tax=Seminavis robusta TaxID=568900 RepID=A0A9N8E9S2_9STRA|nr:Leucine Rich Repeat [Seminavis robusta]|eukprot:Sro703_g190060.1 Leucine Rich Repeat (794) ;mRNA; f:4163-6544